MTNIRNPGLDTLRATAIILVFLTHYTILTGHTLFGPFGHLGGMGVDLFFALSGYLIGNQIFSALKSDKFSLKVFYIRRFLRILPNYCVVLGLYLFLPGFREKPFTVSIWKFIFFIQNFYHTSLGAFSHAWSLCIEEHFYLILPLLALFLVRKISTKFGCIIIIFILLGEIIIRGLIWLFYLKNSNSGVGQFYASLIYAATFTRLDALVLGVALSLLKNYQTKFWYQITKNGNILLIFGIVGYCVVAYIFQTGSYKEFFTIVLNYTLLAVSSTLLTLTALSQNSLLNKIKIPGARTLAIWSFAIYLTHKALIHVTQTILLHWNLNNTDWVLLPSAIVMSLSGGWLLYTAIEKPFLKLRDKIWKFKSIYEQQPTH